MKPVIFALAAAAMFPATAWAGWHENSYKTTYDRMQDIRNTLTRWCATNPDSGSYAEYFSGQSCAGRFDRKEIAGIPFRFDREDDEANLTSIGRWAFAFTYPDATYFVSLVDVTRHQSTIRDAATDQTKTFLEVLRYDAKEASPSALPALAHGVAVLPEGTQRRVRHAEHERLQAGIERVLHDVKSLRLPCAKPTT